jgi:deoxycytidylate deaminase
MKDVEATFMAQALELAQKAEPSPNPRVGCVVADGETVLGEGFHAAAGQDHAEVAALKAAGDRARGTTLYVTLEPCNHDGRTPPCVDAILAAGIATHRAQRRIGQSFPLGFPLTARRPTDTPQRPGSRPAAQSEVSRVGTVQPA